MKSVNDLYEEQKSRTRHYLFKALFECLEQVSYSELSISRLCSAAEISRKTFYAHYGSIDEMVESWFDSRKKEYLLKVEDRTLEQYRPDLIAEEFFDFWSCRRTELLILYQAGYPLNRIFMNTASEIIQIRSHQKADILKAWSAGAFYTLLLEWLSLKQEQDIQNYPAKVIQSFQRNQIAE